MYSGLIFTKQRKRPTGAVLDILRGAEGASVIRKNTHTAPHVLRAAEALLLFVKTRIPSRTFYKTQTALLLFT